MTRLGGHVVADQLVAQGVDTVFGVPGESFLTVLDGLWERRDAIRFVTARHEATASHMAEAWGKLTGRPGVCLATRGPGATHASIGVHTAFQDSTPMLLLLGQVAREHLGREAFQEVDFEAMFAPLAKWAHQIERADDIPAAMTRAFEVALADRPGPVVLALPEDMQRDATDAPDGPRVEPALREPLPARQLLHGLHRRLGIGVACGLELFDLFLELAHLGLHRLIGVPLGLVELGDELLPLGIGLLPGGRDGVLDPLERPMLRLALADLEEPVVAGERVEDVEHEGHVVEVEAEDLVGTIAQAEDPPVQEVDVGNHDRPYRPGVDTLGRPAFDGRGQGHRLAPLLLEDLELVTAAAVAHHLLDLDRAGIGARAHQRGEVDVGRVVLGDRAGEGEEHLLQPGRHGARLGEAVFGSVAGLPHAVVDEHELGGEIGRAHV